MKSRKFSLIGISGILALCYVVLVLIGHTQTSNPDLTNPQELIRKAFPNSKITWSKELEGEMVNFKASPVSVAISTKKGEKRTLEYVNFKEGISWKIDGEKYPYYYYYLIGTEEQKVLVEEYAHESVFITHVFDTKGEKIFELKTNAKVMASPTAKYYYTRPNSTSWTSLRVFDESAKQLWLAATPNTDWYVESLSDSELIYQDYSACILYDALSGDTLWRISFKPYSKLINTIARIVVSKDGNYFVIYDPNGLISLSREGEVMWTSEEFRTIRSAALTHDGKYLALYFGSRKRKGENNFVLLDNLNNGEVKWNKSIDLGNRLMNYEVGLKIVGDVITMLSAMPDFYYMTGINPRTNTYWYQIDLSTGKLLKEKFVAGVIQTFLINNKRTDFLLTPEENATKIFKLGRGPIQ